jgi:hypothetical protein
MPWLIHRSWILDWFVRWRSKRVQRVHSRTLGLKSNMGDWAERGYPDNSRQVARGSKTPRQTPGFPLKTLALALHIIVVRNHVILSHKDRCYSPYRD